MFSSVKLFWRCKLAMYTAVLQTEKVTPFIKNLDKDSLKHVENFLFVATVAVGVRMVIFGQQTNTLRTL